MEVSLREERYDRQQRITWWDQSLLSSAEVIVVGAGALGNEVVKNLALIGVGTIDIYDFDVIELSNLARCVLFRDEDEGRQKATVLAQRATDLNPLAEIRGYVTDVRSLGTGRFARASAIVGALDNIEARRYVNRIAWRLGRPWIDGAIEGLSGIARVFSPPDSCFECTLSELDFEQLARRRSCRLLSAGELKSGHVPTTATTSSIIAGLQAQEVVKQLHSHDPRVRPLVGGLRLEGALNEVYTITYPLRDDCFAHHLFEDPVTITGSENLTWRQLASAVGFDRAVVELGDDFLRAWDCASCASSVSDARPVALVNIGEARCPACDSDRLPSLITSIEVPGPMADETVHSFGTRCNEWYAIRRGSHYRYVSVADPPDDRGVGNG